MRVHVVSDVHGSAEALARAGEGADALVVLGDLLLYVDYADPRLGMLADLFGEEVSMRFAVLRRDHRFAELRSFGAELMGAGDPMEAILGAARRQYTELFAAMPAPTYLTYGNVDIPALWPEFVRPGVTPLDGEVAEIGGWRFGFVGGWVPRHRAPTTAAGGSAGGGRGGMVDGGSGGVAGGSADGGTGGGSGGVADGGVGGAARGAPQPAQIDALAAVRRGFGGSVLRFGSACTPEEYAAKVAAVGAVDVLCCHVPPAVPELRYDTVSRGFEVASTAILDAIRDTQPRYALFGHVHQPLQRRLRIGRTECVNVGHFRGSGEPFVLRW